MSEHAHTYTAYFLKQLLQLLIFVFSISISGISAYSQSSDYVRLDTFTPERHSGEEFADALQVVRKEIIEFETYDRIRELDIYADQLELYTHKDKFSIREAYARHARAYNKYLSDLSNAEKYYLKAHQMYTNEELLNAEWVWHIENPLAVINNQLGDVDKSLYFYEIAEAALRHQGDKNICRLLANKGILLQSKLDYNQARNTYTNGLKLAQRFQYPLAVATNRINLNALNILEKRFDEAKYQLDSIKPLLIDAQIKFKIYESYLDQLAAIAIHDHDYQKAIEYYQNQLNYFDSIYATPFRREYGKLYQKLAEVYLKVDDPCRAKRSIKKGIHSLLPESTALFVDRMDLYEENTFMDLYGTLAQLFAIKYDNTKQRIYLDSALLAYDYALLINDLLIVQFDTDESKYIAAHENNRKVDELIEVLWKKQEKGAPVSNERLLNYLHESKSIVFDDALVRRSKYECLSNPQKEADSLYKQSLASLHHARAISTSDRVKTRLNLNTKLSALYENINTELDIITCAFVNYVISSDHIYAVDNIQGNPRILKLCQTSVWLSTQEKFLDLLMSSEQIDEVKILAHELHQMLLAPLGNLPEEFSIIPEGYLCHLPFDAMVDSNGDWVIENHQIEYRLSMHVLGEKKNRKEKILCVTPDYGPINNLIAYNRSDLYPLKFAKLEETCLRESFKNVDVRSSFNVEALPQILNNYDIFHYSGHARSDENYGSLILDTEEKSVSGAEISNFISTLELAVLSACETGVGTIKEGEGNMSLARSFLSGGTKNVINSLWTVNDQTTTEIIRSFYVQLKKSKNPVLSLRNAKMNYLNLHEGDEAHPYYWAGLIITTTSDSSTSLYFGYYTTIILLCILIIYLFFRIKYKSS